MVYLIAKKTLKVSLANGNEVYRENL